MKLSLRKREKADHFVHKNETMQNEFDELQNELDKGKDTQRNQGIK